MNRPLAAVPILAIVCIVGLFVWGFIKTSPEPFALPPTMPATTPVDALQATNSTVHEVVVMNWPTIAPAPTRGVWQTPTSAVPACPGRDGELCQVMAAPVVVPTTVIAPCTTDTIATFVPGEICRWEDATPIPNTGVTNDLVPGANQYDHDRVKHDADTARVPTPGGPFK